MVAFYWMLISDLLAKSAVTSNNHKLRTKPFWMTRLSGPGPGQWVTKTLPKILITYSQMYYQVIKEPCRQLVKFIACM